MIIVSREMDMYNYIFGVEQLQQTSLPLFPQPFHFPHFYVRPFPFLFLLGKKIYFYEHGL